MVKIRWSKTVFQIGERFIEFDYIPEDWELLILTNPCVFHIQNWQPTFWALLDKHRVGKEFDFDAFVEAFWMELRAVNLIDVNQIVRRILSEKKTPAN